ncbi:RsbRD N-terminal domain-containing protein, partial [Cribrihabitans sp. XS_ASV171]
MPNTGTAHILTLLESDFAGIVDEWVGAQVEEGVKRSDLFSDAESRAQSTELLKALAKGMRANENHADFDFHADAWDDLRAVLADITRERVNRGVTPTEMATFMLALKGPLFDRLQTGLGKDSEALVE